MTPKQQLDKLAAYLLAPKEEASIQLDYDEIASILRDVKQTIEQADKDHKMLMIQTERADILARFAEQQIPHKEYIRLLELKYEINKVLVE